MSLRELLAPKVARNGALLATHKCNWEDPDETGSEFMQSRVKAAGTRADGLPEDLRRPGELIKIGTVARDFNVSPDLLRLYEREGLLVPLKSSAGTRYFTRQDYSWIGTVMQLVRHERMNLGVIRQLLGVLPCWKEEHDSSFEARRNCPARNGDSLRPCWMSTGKHCCHNASQRQCYFCKVYRTASALEGMRVVLSETASEGEAFINLVPGDRA
jgi:DNA-binding transcriptional MerR regulator